MIVSPELVGLNNRERVRYLKARRDGYVYHDHRSTPPGSAAFWKWAYAEQVPVITLSEGMFASRLEIDYLPTDRRPSAVSRRQLSELLALAAEPSSIRICPVRAVALSVPPVEAPALASLLVEFAADSRWAVPYLDSDEEVS
jgi:hypothetical protein